MQHLPLDGNIIGRKHRFGGALSFSKARKHALKAASGSFTQNAKFGELLNHYQSMIC